jgi:hypothetical protein
MLNDKLTILVVIGTDCTDSYKSNYHTILRIYNILVLRYCKHMLKEKIVTLLPYLTLFYSLLYTSIRILKI